jgi:histone H3/H4
MHIDTTITIAPGVRNAIMEASEMTALRVSSLAAACMKRLMKDYQRHVHLDGRVKYRRRVQAPNNWSRQHVRVSRREYEMFLDLRKVCKVSVSLLFDIAIREHLSEVLNDIMNKSEKCADNYPYQHYIIIGNSSENVVCWRIYWGYPDKLQL